MVFINTEDAFENAIKNGLKDFESYMYVYSIKGRDYFKHIETGNYISFKSGLAVSQRFV